MTKNDEAAPYKMLANHFNYYLFDSHNTLDENDLMDQLLYNILMMANQYITINNIDYAVEILKSSFRQNIEIKMNQISHNSLKIFQFITKNEKKYFAG